jgi:hypothetical protein
VRDVDVAGRQSQRQGDDDKGNLHFWQLVFLSVISSVTRRFVKISPKIVQISPKMEPY